MRIFLFAFLLSQTTHLFGQIYTQNAPNSQQKSAYYDCYTQNLDNGNAALRRGEAKEALRFFQTAKDCPEAQGNTRRLSELDTRIARCEAYFSTAPTKAPDEKTAYKPNQAGRKRSFSTESTPARRHYRANQGLLRDTLDACFTQIVAEADRAYRLRFWEDAAALYRAAKNCDDADQKDRFNMSTRITDCRNAAENELFAKQQEAERQARNAIAANLADDAEELLKTTDRSLAFRLADFANQYVAPDDNPDCVQAMFDAWYYQSSKSSKNSENELYKPVFCYEIGENLGYDAVLRYEQQRNGKQWLWSFQPKTGDLYAWEMPTMTEVKHLKTSKGSQYLGFDLSPNGELVFWGSNFFELRQDDREHKIPVPAVTNWCFSERGDEFFYENTAEEKIYVLNTRMVFEQQVSRKGNKYSNILQKPVVAREIISGVPPGLMAMKYVAGNFWLGYLDRVLILSKDGEGKPWRIVRNVPFTDVSIPDYVEGKDVKLLLDPASKTAFLGYQQGGWNIQIPDLPSDPNAPIITTSFKNMYPLALSASTRKGAFLYFGNYGYDSFWLMDPISGDTLLRQRLPDFTGFELLKGAFSTDGKWVATNSTTGNLSVWALQDAPTVWETNLSVAQDMQPLFSTDGAYFFMYHGDTLSVFKTNEPQKPLYTWKEFGYPLYGMANDWALVQISADSAEARHLSDGRRLRLPLSNADGFSYLFAFDTSGEQLVAYLSDWNTVAVRSLKNGALIAQKTFEGGNITSLYCIPGSNQILLKQLNSERENGFGQANVKLWTPNAQNNPIRAPRLHDYPIDLSAVDPSGRYAAFSNGGDIRIFDLQNLENELLKIRKSRENRIMSIAFRPNSNLLAAAYSNGIVIFWDTQTGQSVLQLPVLTEDELSSNSLFFFTLGFSNNGNLLHISTNDKMKSFVIDPSYIRTEAQSGERQLQSFTVDHIVRYNLESALYYSGNFERLAESDDAPLVRTFLQYFGSQAKESNNIERVREYCERAYYLYTRLSDSNKSIWKTEMMEMYEGYAWKLLLRDNLAESSGVLTFIKNQFGQEPLLLSAHVALLNKKCADASQKYTDFLLMDGRQILSTYESGWHFDEAADELSQLRDFNILDTLDTACFCAIVQESDAFASLCAEHQNSTYSVLSTADQFRWNIYKSRSEATDNGRFFLKIDLLEDAYKKAAKLVQISPLNGQVWEETVRLELSGALRDLAVFERHSSDAVQYFESAKNVLTQGGPFQQLSDTARLSLLSANYLAWGTLLLGEDKPSEASEKLNLGLEAISELSSQVYALDSTRLISYYDHLAGPLFEKLGTAFLLLGYPEEARQAYEQSSIYFVTYGLNSLYLGNVSLFEGDETTATLDYGGIFDARQTAEVLFTMDRLGDRFPEKKQAMDAYQERFLTALGDKNPQLTNAESKYWFANLKTEFFAGISQYDSAIYWSEVQLMAAKRSDELPNTGSNWVQNWLNEHINLAYYVLLGQWDQPEGLQRCIDLSEKGLKFIQNSDREAFSYSNQELFKTNYAHALVLRNQPGDREKALELYHDFMKNYADSRGYDNLELLEKDFRDLKAAGAPWPNDLNILRKEE